MGKKILVTDFELAAAWKSVAEMESEVAVTQKPEREEIEEKQGCIRSEDDLNSYSRSRVFEGCTPLGRSCKNIFLRRRPGKSRAATEEEMPMKILAFCRLINRRLRLWEMQRITCYIVICPAPRVESRLCPYRENQSATMQESEQKWKRKIKWRGRGRERIDNTRYLSSELQPPPLLAWSISELLH